MLEESYDVSNNKIVRAWQIPNLIMLLCRVWRKNHKIIYSFRVLVYLPQRIYVYVLFVSSHIPHLSHSTPFLFHQLVHLDELFLMIFIGSMLNRKFRHVWINTSYKNLLQNLKIHCVPYIYMYISKDNILKEYKFFGDQLIIQQFHHGPKLFSIV